MTDQKQAQPKTIETQAREAAVRNDPIQRYADGAEYGTGLKNADPDRKYVLVYLSDLAMGVEFYKENGYVVELYREDGPKFFAAKTGKTGDAMEWRGHVLMSIGKAEHAALRKYGAPGAGKGADAWTKIEKVLLARDERGGKPDYLRGISGKEFMHVVNEGSVTEGKGRI